MWFSNLPTKFGIDQVLHLNFYINQIVTTQIWTQIKGWQGYIVVRIFKQYIPVSFVILGFVEIVLFAFSIYAGVVVRFVDSASQLGQLNMHLPSDIGTIYPKASAFSLVMFVSLGAMGLYQRRFRHGLAGMVLRLLSAFIAGAVAISLIYYAFPSLFLGRGVMAWAFFFSMVTILIVRIIFLKTVDQQSGNLYFQNPSIEDLGRIVPTGLYRPSACLRWLIPTLRCLHWVYPQ